MHIVQVDPIMSLASESILPEGIHLSQWHFAAVKRPINVFWGLFNECPAVRERREWGGNLYVSCDFRVNPKDELCARPMDTFCLSLSLSLSPVSLSVSSHSLSLILILSLFYISFPTLFPGFLSPSHCPPPTSLSSIFSPPIHGSSLKMEVGVAPPTSFPLSLRLAASSPPALFLRAAQNSGGTFPNVTQKAIASKGSNASNYFTIQRKYKGPFIQSKIATRISNSSTDRIIRQTPNIFQQKKTMFRQLSTSNVEWNSRTAPSEPLTACPPCKCRQRPSFGLPMMLLLITLCMLLVASPSVCSAASSLLPMSDIVGQTLPMRGQSASTFSSSSAAAPSAEEFVPKRAMKMDKEWAEEEEEEGVNLVLNTNTLKKKPPHRMVGKRQMKRAAAPTEAAADEAEKAAREEPQSCTVRVQVVKKVKGKCVRLHGGQSACQSADYLDPVNEDCLFA